MKDLLHELIETVLQSVAYKLGDLINDYPKELQPMVLAVIRIIIDSLEKLLDDDERTIYDHVMQKSELTILPTALDPREPDGEE